MSQYNLHPANAVMQQLTAQPTQLGQTQTLPPIPGLPAYQPSPQELQTGGSLGQSAEATPSVSAPVRNYARIDIPEAQLGQTEPTDTSAMAPLVKQGPAPDQLTQYYQQQLQGYDNPWYKQHPIATRFLGMQQYGLPGLFMAPQIAQRLVDQNKARTLIALNQAQHANATNETNLGAYNALASSAGLPQATPGSIIDKDQITTVQALVQKHGAPAFIAARDRFNQDTINYERAQQALATYQARKDAGLLQPIGKDKDGKPIYPAAPVVPAAPIFNIDGINPYLDAGSAAGLVGTSGEAANTGEKSGEAASDSASKEKEANARIEEAKAANAQAQQVHNDSIAQQEATRAQGEQHFQSDLNQRQAEHTDTIQARRENLAYKEWEDSQKSMDAITKKIDDNDKEFVQLSTKYKGNADRIRKDPAYTVINLKRKQLEAQRDQALAASNQKLARYKELTGEGQSETPPHTATAPHSVSTGHTLNQAQPTIKIRIPRSVALKHKLIH